LLKSGEQLYDTSLEAYTPTPVPNMLSGVHEDLHNHLKTRAGSLAQRLVDDAKQPKKKTDEAVFSTYRVRFSSSPVLWTLQLWDHNRPLTFVFCQ
jgi:hypothetical protein